MQQHQVTVAPGGGEGGAAGDHLQQDGHQGVGGKTRDGTQLVGLDVQDREHEDPTYDKWNRVQLKRSTRRKWQHCTNIAHMKDTDVKSTP